MRSVFSRWEMSLTVFFCRINAVWREGREQQELIHIYLPEFEQGPTEYYVVICLRNISNLNSDLVIKRKQLCTCKKIEVKKNFNTTKYMYDCPHRDALTIDITDTKFYVSLK